jgi:hypothetical protein
MTPAELNATIDASLHGTAAPNGVHDLLDIFWLMGWADWSIEKQLIEKEQDEGQMQP